MKTIDDVRGLEREIKFTATGGYTTGGALPLTNCVVEIRELDFQLRSPTLSLRFYHKPTYPHQVAEKSAESGRPLYDENTPIGVEISLGPELAQSLIEQISAKWPEFVRVIQE